MRKTILFVCQENRARSQIAEGLANHILDHEIISAGATPAARIHPLAVTVMAEIGIDISMQKPKNISEIDLNGIDLVITLCANEACPVFPPRIERLHWELPDPAADELPEDTRLRKFRKIRDTLNKQIRQLGERLTARNI